MTRLTLPVMHVTPTEPAIREPKRSRYEIYSLGESGRRGNGMTVAERDVGSTGFVAR
jgi:hypothetical protein